MLALELSKFVDHFKKNKRVLIPIVDKFMVIALNKAKKEIQWTAAEICQNAAPNYQKSITREIKKGANEIKGKLIVNHPAAVYLEEGTGIYKGGNRIYPKHAKALRFPISEYGRPRRVKGRGKVMPGDVIFAKSIKGMKRRRIIFKASKKFKPELDRVQQKCTRALNKALILGR